MAFANLLTLIDDIASLLDDVAVLTKTAGAKTAGVLGDDLALNAQQVSGVRVDRELPVVWAVFKECSKARCSTSRFWCRWRWPSAPLHHGWSHRC